MDITHNYIKSLVEKYYTDYSHIIPLDYQKNYIYNAVYNYIKVIDTLTKGQLVKNHFVDDFDELYKTYCSESKTLRNLDTDRSNLFSHSFVINLDVGLGKTITSIITSRVMKTVYEDLYNFEKELFIRKIEKDISNKEGFNKKILQDVYSAITSKMNNYTESTFKVGIVARRNLCLEFNEFIKDHEDFLYYPYGRNFDQHRDKTNNKELGELLVVFFQYNYQVDLELNSFPYDIFIVDEFGSDPVFFGESK